MLKKLTILAMALAIGSGSLFALVHPRYDQCECWGVQAEYLYWLPDVGSTEFVSISSDPGFDLGTIYNNSLGFQSGFRVEGAFALDCGGEIHGRYVWLYASHGNSLTNPPGDFLFQLQGIGGEAADVGGYIGSASTHPRLHYQNAELLFSKRVWDSFSCSEFYLFGGLDFYYGKYTEHYFYDNFGAMTDDIHRSTKNYAIGPELGIDFSMPLNEWLSWCGCEGFNLSFVGQASGALLAQQETNTYFDKNSSEPLPWQDLNTHHSWRVIQAWNARGGLCYAGECCSINYKLEAGYEFTSYINALKKFELKGSGGGFFDISYHNLSFQGLYVALGLAF